MRPLPLRWEQITTFCMLKAKKTVGQFFLLNKGTTFSENYNKVSQAYQKLGIPTSDVTTSSDIQEKLSEQGKKTILQMRKKEKAMQFLYSSGQANKYAMTRPKLINAIFNLSNPDATISALEGREMNIVALKALVASSPALASAILEDFLGEDKVLEDKVERTL